MLKISQQAQLLTEAGALQYAYKSNINIGAPKLPFKQLLVWLNTVHQLYMKGIDIFENKLRSIHARLGNVYAYRTIFGTEMYKGKIEKGQPIDRVTLYDTGAFYKSFKAKLEGEGIVITANTNKDGEDLEQTWGSVVGLTERSKNDAAQAAKPIIISYVQNTILRNNR